MNRPSVADLEMNTGEWSDGYHELRAIAYLQGAVRPQVFAITGFKVNRKGRRVQFDGLNGKAEMDLFHPYRVDGFGHGQTATALHGLRRNDSWRAVGV